MNVDGYSFMLDTAAKFFNTLHISGWFHHPGDRLKSVTFSGQPVLGVITEVNVPHAGVATLGANKGFSLHILRAEELIPESAALTFTSANGWSTTIALRALCADRIALYPGHEMVRRFRAAVAERPSPRILDIGGRSRSAIDRSQSFVAGDISVLDILPGDNVDIVADAHDMSIIPPESFDAVYSVSVFEHLMMPWAVIPQIHRILKPGGIVLIHTHQTIGMHDTPWDFWRFSDTAWDALFNARTGFKILRRHLEGEQFIVPFITTDVKAWAERAAGYEGTAVLAHKTGPCTLAWPVVPADLTTTAYPPGTENPYERKS